MNTPVTPAPVRYSPDVEKPADDEAETIAELRETLLKIAKTMQEHTGHGMRSVHAKSFGLLRGTLEVLPNLPPHYAQGVFSEPKTYDIVARLSTPPAEELDDRVSLPRGLSLKIIGVEGDRLPGSEGDATQDFLMVNGPAFNAPDAKHFLSSLKQLAATTDKAEGGKRVLSAVLRGVTAALGAVGIESPKLVSMGGHQQTQPLGETFFTQVPQRYGDFIAKLSLAPISPSLTSLTDQPLPDDLADDPDGLRKASNHFFASNDGEWELRVQLNTDLETMPIEDATVQWPEEHSPYIAVARLRIGRQTAWSEERSVVVDDRMAFDPWHGIEAHRPLGGVMRARKAVYPSSAEFRGTANGCPIHEPKSGESISL